MGFDDICKAGPGVGLDLDLDLGLGVGNCLVEQENVFQSVHKRKKKKFISVKYDQQFLPTLTLGPSTDQGDHQSRDHHQQASSPSAVSSFSNSSVKREGDLGGEEVELERVSSRVSDEDEEGSPRKKLRLTKEQAAVLEDSFKAHSTLNPVVLYPLNLQIHIHSVLINTNFF